MGLCVTCAVSIKRGQNDSITCSACSKLYHLTCASLKQDDIDYLNSLNKSWSCVTCTKKSKNIISVTGNSIQPLTSLSTTEPDLKLIISHLDNLRAEQAKLIDLVNAQNEKLNSFDNKFHEIFSQLSSIKNENSVLRKATVSFPQLTAAVTASTRCSDRRMQQNCFCFCSQLQAVKYFKHSYRLV
ncbi:unnamed protein product [Macrosiphum euphorbiae]|uniref:PHD-type domain-containing protein n=1 Tax=Macrosiphum euphorbiae TaxID=13131 RepID=A0AAV0Y7P9_9HEMI|nr:unnamed protein product [Macrosiphum euphorbiae]